MKVNTHRMFQGNTITIKKVIGHTITDEEMNLLNKINACKYGYNLSNKEILDEEFCSVLDKLEELELIKEDKDACYNTTAFGKEFLEEK